MADFNKKTKLSYSELVNKTNYNSSQIYNNLSSLIQKYDIDLDDVNESVTDVDREKIYIGEVVFDSKKAVIDHTGTIDFDADFWEYTGNEPLIKDAIQTVFSKWKAKEPVYDEHPLTAYDRSRYTSILNKRRMEMFSDYGVHFGIGIEKRNEDCEPIDKLRKSINMALSEGGSSRSGVFLSAYIRGLGGIRKISQRDLAKGVEEYQGHNPSEVLNGVVRRDGESLRQAIRRRYTDYPLHQNKTPHVLTFRQLEGELTLPQPAIGIYRERGVYSDQRPQKHVELRGVYTPEGFVPPIDRKLADEYRRSVAQDADPKSDIPDLFTGSPTTHVGRVSQLAGRFDQDEVSSQWTIQNRPTSYEIAYREREPVDNAAVEVPIYIPNVDTDILAKYLSPVAIDSYINAQSHATGEKVVETAIDELVEIYGIERSVAKACVDKIKADDYDGYYLTNND